MDMRVTTLENGMRAVVADKPAPTPEQSAFAAELDRVAEAAKQAEASGSTKLQAACGSLTPSSKAVLERMKAGASDITEDEWKRLRQELAAAGLITSDELFHSDLHIICVGHISDFTDANGVVQNRGRIATQLEVSPSLSGDDWNIKWAGDPLQYLDQWLQLLRDQRGRLSKQFRPDGTSYDTSFYTRQIEANEKVSDLVKSLLELC